MAENLNGNDFFNPETGTAHINAKLGEIADIVLMAGDPLRAEKMANHFLINPKKVSWIRNMFVFTGIYKKHKITFMGHGMGAPSMGIYSYEVMKFYKSKIVIRVGTCGALAKDVGVGDLIISQGACTDSKYDHQYRLPGTYSAISDYELLKNAVEYAKKQGLKHFVGNILSSNFFYDASDSLSDWSRLNVLATDMEAYALYCNAAYLGRKALTILTVSDHVTNPKAVKLTPTERQEQTLKMAEVALHAALHTKKPE